MKHWPTWILVLSALGGLGSPVLWSSLLSYVQLALLSGAAILFICHRLTRPFGIFCLTFALASVHLVQRLSSQLPPQLEKQNLQITLAIRGIPVTHGNIARFEADVIAVDSHTLQQFPETASLIGRKIRLSWRFSEKSNPSLAPGQHWQLTCRLKRPRGLVNPSGFDYQAWLLQKNIVATGYVYARERVELLDSESPMLLDRTRYQLVQRLTAALARHSDTNRVGLMRALLVGDKSKISQAQWAVLNATGTTHLMAISGLHIGLVAIFAFIFAKLFLPLLCWQSKPILLRGCVSLVCILAASFYAMLASFAIPTQRALFLIMLVNIAFILGKKVSIFYLLLLVALFVVALDPFAFLQKGFWLSFAAVSVLLWCFSGRALPVQGWRSLLWSQWVVFIGLMLPLTILALPLSPLSPFANVWAIPVVSFLCIPLLLLAALLWMVNTDSADFCIYLADQVLYWVMLGLEKLSSVGTTIDPSWHSQIWSQTWALPVAVLAVFLFLSPWRLRLQLPVLVLLALLPLSSKMGKDKITVLDVGQGLSVSLQLHGDEQTFVALYDTGARFSPEFDTGSRIILPYLQAEGVKKLDLLTVSHGDNDHAGGLSGIVNSMPTEQLLLGKIEGVLAEEMNRIEVPPEQILCLTELMPLLEHSAGEKHQTSSESLDGSLLLDDSLSLEGSVSLSVLWPEVDSVIPQDRNNQSCVLLFKRNDFTLLLTGDIEKEVEHALLASGRLPKNIDVLLAPHHGSKTSSSFPFVHHLSPKHVIFSAGYRNRYHHPAAAIVQRYIDIESQIWQTALDGAITIQFDNNGYAIYGERKVNPKPWYD